MGAAESSVHEVPVNASLPNVHGGQLSIQELANGCAFSAAECECILECLAVLSAWAPTNDVRIWISLLLRLEALSAFQAVVKPAWPVYKGRPVAPPFKWTKLWPKVKHQSRFVTIHARQMQSFVEFVLSKRSFIEAGSISSRGASPVSL